MSRMKGNFHVRFLEEGERVIALSYSTCLQKNNIFLVIVFGELLENLQLLSQLKLRKCVLEIFNEGKRSKIVGDFKNTCLINWKVFRKKR